MIAKTMEANAFAVKQTTWRSLTTNFHFKIWVLGTFIAISYTGISVGILVFSSMMEREILIPHPFKRKKSEADVIRPLHSTWYNYALPWFIYLSDYIFNALGTQRLFSRFSINYGWARNFLKCLSDSAGLEFLNCEREAWIVV